MILAPVMDVSDSPRVRRKEWLARDHGVAQVYAISSGNKLQLWILFSVQFRPQMCRCTSKRQVSTAARVIVLKIALTTVDQSFSVAQHAQDVLKESF